MIYIIIAITFEDFKLHNKNFTLLVRKNIIRFELYT